MNKKNLSINDDFALTEKSIRELPMNPLLHKLIAEKNGYKFFEDIDSFRIFFDTTVEYPSESVKKDGLEDSFFLVKRRDKSILCASTNLHKQIKDVYNIDCNYVESEDILINYTHPTIVKVHDNEYCLLGLKNIEAHKYSHQLIEEELIKKHNCYYLDCEDEKIYLCVLFPTAKINNPDLDFDEIIFVSKDIAHFKFGGEADFDYSKLDKILEYMIKRNIGNLHFNGNGDSYSIIIDEDKKLKTIAQATNEKIENELIYKLKKDTNEDEYNEFKEIKKAFSYSYHGTRRDFRLSIKKSKAGYRCAFRLLSSEQMIGNFENLNYTNTAIGVFKRLTDEEFGIQKGMPGIIVAGSAGEGKSTLAYTMIKQLLKYNKLIAEIGNPVEIRLSDATITQFDLSDTENAEEDQRDTLLNLLSVQKRQNPDILYITEVRDAEEKKEVFNHIAQGFGMIFTMHTHNTWKTLEDLMTVMGEEAYKVGDSIGAIINHKLIKSVCLQCKGLGHRGGEVCLNCKGGGEKGLVPIIEKWERKKSTKILPAITKNNYDSPEVCENFHSFRDDILEQYSLGRITKITANIELAKLYGEKNEYLL